MYVALKSHSRIMDTISYPTYYRISPRIVVTNMDNYIDIIKGYGSTWLSVKVPKTLVHYMVERVDQIKARSEFIDIQHIDVEEFVTPVFDWEIHLSMLTGSSRILRRWAPEDLYRIKTVIFGLHV